MLSLPKKVTCGNWALGRLLHTGVRALIAGARKRPIMPNSAVWGKATLAEGVCPFPLPDPPFHLR